MKYIKKLLILLLFTFLLFSKVILRSNLRVTATSAILMEKETHRVLYEKDIHTRYLTASITKIMTAIIAIELGDLDRYYKVDFETTRQIGSSIYLEVGTHIKLEDLIYGLLLRSGNDAAHMIAIIISSSVNDFADLMNEYAKKIKMYNSTFENPSGLDDDSKNYSTAYDMALLMSYCMSNDIFRKMINTKKHVATTLEGNKKYFTHTHRLIGTNKEITGGKPGYTEKALRTLITTKKKNNMELIVVTFRCGNDWEVHQNLFDYGFNNYFSFILLKKQIIIFSTEVYKYQGVILKDVAYPVTKDEVSNLSCIVYFYKKPSKDNIIGYAQIYLSNQELYKVNIYRRFSNE